MRTRFAIVFLFVASVAISAEPTDAEKLATSLEKWTAAKKECGGNYSYKVIQSSFTGFRAETLVVVKDNKVVERKYSTATPKEPGGKAELKQIWSETEKEIGKNKQGAEALTLDQLYEGAKKIVEKEVPAEHVRSIAFDKMGILQYCFLRDKRIADDAPLTGVKPIYLTLEKK